MDWAIRYDTMIQEMVNLQYGVRMTHQDPAKVGIPIVYLPTNVRKYQKQFPFIKKDKRLLNFPSMVIQSEAGQSALCLTREAPNQEYKTVKLPQKGSALPIILLLFAILKKGKLGLAVLGF